MKHLRLAIVLTGVLAGLAPSVAGARGPLQYVEYQWRIHRLSAPYRTFGRWRPCAMSHGGTITCSRGITVSNSLSGQIGVSIQAVSASVGFDVTWSTTITGGSSFTVPKHRTGVEQWRSVYSTRAVHQRQFKRYWACVPRGACGPVSRWIATKRYETAYASKFVVPDFRLVLLR